MSSIVVITGPMKSGKTKKLIQLYKIISIQNNLNPIMIKPSIDNRFSQDKVVSRDGDSIQCYNVRSLKDIIDIFALEKINNIFIDEFQFIKGNINQLLEIKNKDVNLYISGLERTSELKPFKIMKDALKIADVKVYLTGKCQMCGNPSEYTYYKGNKTNNILIGDDCYLTVCKSCYYKLRNKEILI